MTPLLEQLSRLEAELHHPGAACTRERLELLLHPDFHEIGRSGRPYARAVVIDWLVAHPPAGGVVASNYALHPVAPDCWLLTYRSMETGGANAALRASIWVRTAAGWQLLFHQGTPAAQG